VQSRCPYTPSKITPIFGPTRRKSAQASQKTPTDGFVNAAKFAKLGGSLLPGRRYTFRHA
jgi:hypothetical protein